MGLYLTQARLTPEAVKAWAASGEDRRDVINGMMESVGGRLVSYYFSFGESDIVVIIEAPDNQSIASALLAVSGAGGVADIKTTVLMSYEEGLEALRRSASITYTPPGGKYPF